MPVSITKANVSKEQIKEIVFKAFGQEAESIEELTEGFFNVAYKIQLHEKVVILKIAPPGETELMTYEKNIMASEVAAMQQVAALKTVPIPKILFYDAEHVLYPSTYFFMDCLEGSSFASCMEQMSEAEKAKIQYDMGVYTKQINTITHTKFGYYGQEEKQQEGWYNTFQSMLEDVYADAMRKKVVVPVTEEVVLQFLERDKEVFEAVKIPQLVHWDIWAGNVFVKDNKVTGIIDFERCLWADPLMEYGFRTFDKQEAFFEGYGIKALSQEASMRARWYDIYLFLIWCCEGAYRQYADKSLYEYGCSMLVEGIDEIKHMK